MKYSILTYYLLAILCVMATSCDTEGVTDGRPTNSPTELIEGGKIKFALNFPTGSTRSVTGETDEGLSNERTVKDARIYTFVENRFVERVQYVLISGKDGDASRYVEGKLAETYTPNSAMTFVVIVNAESKNVPDVQLAQGDSKNDLYRQLIYAFDGNRQKWSKDIPMWGEGTISSMQPGNNLGQLTLQRAIAKVNITVNDGKGIEKFKITKVDLYNYNTAGYCAPLNDGGPSIPAGVVSSGKMLSADLSGLINTNRIENQFYIPEHQNVGRKEDQKVYLALEAEVKGKKKSYRIEFKENGKDYDVLRNYIYVFNITHVKMDDVTPTLDYEVKAWNEEEVNIPSFD